MWLPARQVEASPCQMKRGAEDVEDKRKEKGIAPRGESGWWHCSEDAGNNTHTEKVVNNEEERSEQSERWISLKIDTRVVRGKSSVAVCPVRRQCPRFQAPGYTLCRAGHDQGPHGYPVSEVGPMVRSVTLLTVIVTLSLERPHSSCKDARPEALAGTKTTASVGRLVHISQQEDAERRRRRRMIKIKTG